MIAQPDARRLDRDRSLLLVAAFREVLALAKTLPPS
jgi:hypothetical protein